MRTKRDLNKLAGIGSKATKSALRVSLLASALCALLGASGAQAATVTVGSPLTASFSASVTGPPATLANTALPEPGANLTSPVTGTVVRWRITNATGGPFELRVLTPGTGTTYTGGATSAPATPSSTATQTFATNMPIQAGQTVGLDDTTGGHLGATNPPGATSAYWTPPLGNGETRAATNTNPNVEFGFNADVQPFPSVGSVSPSSGSTAGGTTVTIIGHNFTGATAVNFGSTPAASFSVFSDSVIMAVTRPSPAGTVDVTVKNPGQSATSAADRFRFVKKCVVPKLKGKTLKKARKALKKAHCKLGKVKGPKGKNARIKKQKPKPGKVLAAGSKVRVTTKKKK